MAAFSSPRIRRSQPMNLTVKKNSDQRHDQEVDEVAEKLAVRNPSCLKTNLPADVALFPWQNQTDRRHDDVSAPAS